MGYKSTLSAIAADDRRQLREAQRRARDLARQAKEQARLSELERARLEVERYDSRIEVLLSIHKDQNNNWDWHALLASLPPPKPERKSWHELKAMQRAALMSKRLSEDSAPLLEAARRQDDQEFALALQVSSEQQAELERMQALAKRILVGEERAYTEALVELNPFAELSDLGSTIHFTIHSANLLECKLKVNSRQAIPAEVKSLSSSGKLSAKPMPRGQFHEIYQDYLSGCVLRVAREVFGLLPAKGILVTALADCVDSATGISAEKPVLSVFMARDLFCQLNFEQLDPAEVIDRFVHRGEFKATRKSGSFQPVSPLTLAELPSDPNASIQLQDLIGRIQTMRAELNSAISGLQRSGAFDLV